MKQQTHLMEKKNRKDKRVEKTLSNTTWDEKHWDKRTEEIYSVKETYHCFESGSAQLCRD